jgi:hypothetical protein
LSILNTIGFYGKFLRKATSAVGYLALASFSLGICHIGPLSGVKTTGDRKYKLANFIVFEYGIRK